MLHRSIGLLATVLCIMMLSACATPQLQDSSELHKLTQAIETLRSSKQPLDLEKSSSGNVSLRVYRQYYDLDVSSVTDHFGYVSSGAYELAVHVWRTSAPAAGTVYLVHGYYNHVGLLGPLIRFMIREGYHVVAFDLPGHGLSSGARATIPSFRDYQDALNSVHSRAAPHLPEPTLWIGHSLGGGVLIREILTEDRLPKDHVVLLAPLVRSAHWQLSRAAYWLVRPLAAEVPRHFPKLSHDPAFNRFIRRRDPLQYRAFPLQWASALFAFYKVIEEAAPNRHVPVTIFQGTADTIVSWRYNLEFLKAKLPRSTLYHIPRARHELVNESSSYRGELFDKLRAALPPQ